MTHLPDAAAAAIRAGWQYESTADALEIVSVTALSAGELASLTRAGSTGCEDLVEALDALADDAPVYDVTDGTCRAVYTADGALIWALS